MRCSRRSSPPTASVVLVLGADPQAWRHGYDLCRETGLKAGTMYPLLKRQADQGLLVTTWETTTVPGRPPRHLDRLTGSGHALVLELSRAADAADGLRAARGGVLTKGGP